MFLGANLLILFTGSGGTELECCRDGAVSTCSCPRNSLCAPSVDRPWRWHPLDRACTSRRGHGKF
jgi:hypothetical protein